MVVELSLAIVAELRLRFDGSKLFRVVPRNLDFGYDRFLKDNVRGRAHTTRAKWSQHLPVNTLSPDLGYYLGGHLLMFQNQRYLGSIS